MERLRTAGFLTIFAVGFILLLPVSVISAYITIGLTAAALQTIVMLALVWWVFSLPAFMVLSIIGKEKDTRWVAGALVVSVIAWGSLFAWFRADQLAKTEDFRPDTVAAVEAGKKALCNHPSNQEYDGHAAWMMASATQWALDDGWTCYTGGEWTYQTTSPYTVGFDWWYSDE